MIPGAIMVAGTTLSLIGQYNSNLSQAEQERQNAAFYEDQAQFARLSTARAEALASFDYSFKMGSQIGAFAASGIDVGSGSAAITIGGSIKQAVDELFAIKKKGELDFNLARMRGNIAGENAALLSSAGYNLMQAGATALNAYGKSEGFGGGFPSLLQPSSAPPSNQGTLKYYPGQESLMQIPLVNPQQRIEPSTPVAVASSESVAGVRAGRATEALGDALFKFGNILDEAGKRAKDEEDKLNVQIAVNNARFQMLDKQAQQEAAQIQQGDRADGFSGAERFKTEVDKTNSQIALGLGNPRLQRMFYAAIGDDVVRSSTMVRADEVKKREENLAILRQDNINGKAANLRKEFALGNTLNAPATMAAIEQDIMTDKNIADADKLKIMSDAKKQVAKESLAGLMDRGNKGDTRAFNKAKSTLVSNYAQIFTSDEMDKEMKNIDQAEENFYQRDWQKYTREQRLEADRFKRIEDVAISEYTSSQQAAANDQFKMNAVMDRIQIDPRLSAETKKTLLQNRIFAERQDDMYEGNFMSNLVTTKDYLGGIEQLRRDYQNGNVSADRRNRLIKSLESLQDYKRTDPTIMNHINTVEGQIKSLGKTDMIVDPMTGLLQAQYDKVTAARLTAFTARVAKLSSDGRLTVENINAARDAAMAGSGQESFVRVPPAGVTAENLNDPYKARDALVQEFAEKGSTWSPQILKQKKKQYEFMLKQIDQDVKNKQLKIMRGNDVKGKAFDEQVTNDSTRT